MTKEQIALVKKTWGILREVDPVLIGDVFYRKLFLDVPQVEHLFHSTRESQSQKLVNMLNVIVSQLDDLSTLTDDIAKLAHRHVRYGAKEHHYKAVGVALIWTLQQGLGRDWNDEVNDAWAVCFQILSSAMIEASGYHTNKLAS